MDDREFIIYLCEEILNIVADGDDPDLKTIERELISRGINPDDVFVY